MQGIFKKLLPGGKRKQGDEEEDKGDALKRPKLSQDEQSYASHGIDTEPTLLVVEEEEGPTQIVEEEGEGAEEGQQAASQPEKSRPTLVRQYSSQMHLDSFLDKMKDKQTDDQAHEEKGQENSVDMDATQLVEDGPPSRLSLPSSCQVDSNEGEDKNALTTAPALEAPNSELSTDYVDAWDDEHIRLPCSPKNTYRRFGARSKRLLSRWYLIHTVLSVPIRSSIDLQEAMIAYNCTEDSQYAQYWDFTGIHYFFQQLAAKEEFDSFFNSTLPFIVKLTLRLPELFKNPTRLLGRGEDGTLFLTQEQVACLLANGFLCTFPKQGPKQLRSDRKSEYPSFSFHTLFMGTGDRCLPNQAAKLRCVFHYFERISQSMPAGVVSFERKVLEDEPAWGSFDASFAGLVVHSEGCIEEVEEECLQVDFANKMVGGGVLGYGCIQEEIRFLINTELIVSLLFTAQLQDNECLLVTGAERYAKYTGYAQTFRYAGDYEDKTPRDHLKRRRTQIVAMDALYFGNSPLNRLSQYRIENIERELNKCFVAFTLPSISPLTVTPVATGNWGCGAFGGFHDIKAIIQLMACSVAQRPMRYFTFGEPGLANALEDIYSFLQKKQVTVGGLWEVLRDLSCEVSAYLDDSKNEKISLTDAPQLFNLLYDRFDTATKEECKQKGKEKLQSDEEDEATIEL